MALSIPTVQQLQDHAWDQSIPDNAYTQGLLRQSRNLFYIATGLTEDPEDIELEIVQDAIMAMGYSVYLSNPDREKVYGPFESEKIGSYFYKLKTGQPTEVGLFDTATSYFRQGANGTSIPAFTYDDSMLVQRDDGQLFIFGPEDQHTYDINETNSLQPHDP